MSYDTKKLGLYPINPFIGARKYINFARNKEVINHKLEHYISFYSHYFKEFDKEFIKQIFWKLVNGEKLNSNNWQIQLSFLIGRFMMFEILKIEGRINLRHYELNRQWFEYLMKRIIPHVHEISNIFFAKIYSNYPVGKKEQMVNVIKRITSDFERNNFCLYN